jgi:hypothetical protein
MTKQRRFQFFATLACGCLIAMSQVHSAFASVTNAAPRSDINSQVAHEDLVAKAKQFHHSPLGHKRQAIPPVLRELEDQFLWLERRRFWLGR